MSGVETIISVLNGALGDYLQARDNGLALPMALFHDGRPLPRDRAALARAHPAATGRICLLVHGLGESERSWSFPRAPGTTYGSLLRRDVGLTPYYVRYNTGLHISENGELLARLLGEIVARHPVEVRELVLLGHSMGGLVARSACHVAARDGVGWLRLVSRVFYLGSPHLGAPLEKVGNVVGWALRAVRSPHARVIADLIDLRSAGVKDLRYANLVAEDWQGHDADALLQDRRTALPLPAGIAHHALVGTLTRHERDLITRLLGDAMVRVSSAAGRSRDPARIAPLPQERVRVFGGVAHRALAHHPRVYREIRARCREEPS